MAEVLKRNEIEDKYKWHLQDIFSSEEEWKKAIEVVKLRANEFERFKGRIGESAKTLFEALAASDAIGELLLSVYAYAGMLRDEDNEISAHRAMADLAGDVESECVSACSFLEPELIAIGRDKIKSFATEIPALEVYNQYFDNLFREAEHILDEKSERLLAMSSPMGEAAHDIFSAMNNADISFGKIKDENGEETELTHGRYGVFMESGVREVRKSAYNAMYRQYKAFKNTFATMYSGNVKSDLFYAKARDFTSTLSMRLSDSNVDESVYNTLIDEVNRGIPVLNEYLKLRKRILGLDELYMYDLYAPIVSEDEETIPYEEACRMVLQAVAPLGEKYVDDMQKALDSHWVDVYENKGKTPGAYSWGDNTTHPYVLLNYQGKLEDVFTLAHEMGHAMHSYYTNNTQPSVYRSYKIFVAEVASIVNENLLLEYLLRDATGKRRAYLLGRKLEAIRTTFYRQTMFAEFEKEAHAMYASSTPLTAESLSGLYSKINSKYYADVCVCDENISYEWARIPHFYTSFYVYQYATGYAAATRIKDLVLKDAKAAERYVKFLSGGSSDYPLELLKMAGVDLSSGEAAECVVEDMQSAVCELSALLDK